MNEFRVMELENMNKITFDSWDDGNGRITECYSVEDQCWTREAVRELRLKYGIFFMSHGCDAAVPVKLLPNNIIVFGTEDDGCIRFTRKYGAYESCCSTYFINGLVEDLHAVQDYVDGAEAYEE